MIITREIAQELAHGGWREEPLGYYSSGQQLKPLEGWAFLVRRTPLASMGIQNGDIATISPAGDPENPLMTSTPGRGQISVWAGQNSCLTPTPAPIGNSKKHEIKSLARLRSGHESLVLGFDTEWGSDGSIISMQFSSVEGNDLVEMVFLSKGVYTCLWKWLLGAAWSISAWPALTNDPLFGINIATLSRQMGSQSKPSLIYDKRPCKIHATFGWTALSCPSSSGPARQTQAPLPTFLGLVPPISQLPRGFTPSCDPCVPLRKR